MTKDQIALLVVEAYRAGQEDERELCAQVCDQLAAKDSLSNYYKHAALLIRERGAP